MFDSIAPAPSPARRWRKFFFGVSGLLHVGAVAAFIVSAMWRVDKLSYAHEAPQLSIMPPLPGNSGGGPKPQANKQAVKPPPIHKTLIKTPVQPVHVAIHEEQTTTTTAETIGDGGGGDGKGTGAPTIGTGCTHEPCGIAEVAPPDPPKPCTDPSRAADPDCAPPPPKPPHDGVVVERLRLSGETQIQPPDDVKIMMSHEGKQKLHGAFRVCLDERGAVTSTTRVGSTGYDAYDDRLAAAMAGWKYRPYTVDGKAEAVCGAVTFVYIMK